MFLLDTNVVSELRKVRMGRADRGVEKWSDTVDAAGLYISVIALLELEIGILLMERRDAKQGAMLRLWLNNLVLPEFADRTLPIDASVARCCAGLHVPDPKSDRDAFVAGTALVHGMTVVTRNVADFSTTGATVFNPWADAK